MEEVGEHHRDSIKLCELLGYQCNFETELAAVADGIAHLRYDHNAILMRRNEACIFHHKWDKVKTPSSAEVSWNPVILELGKEGATGGAYALIYSTTMKRVGSWSVSVMILLEQPTANATDFEATINVFTSSGNELNEENIHSEMWPLVKLSRATRELSSFSTSHMPLASLANNFIEDNALRLLVHVGEVGGRRVQDPRDGGFVKVYPVRKGDDSLGNFQCGECSDWIVDFVPVKYKCLNCPQLSICQRCVTLKQHQHHLFAMCLNRPQEKYLVGLSPIHGLLPILEIPPPQVETSLGIFSSSFLCDECGKDPIRGTLYRCLYCPEGVDYCGNCVKRGIHSFHLLAPIVNETQEIYVESLQEEARRRRVGIINQPRGDVQMG